MRAALFLLSFITLASLVSAKIDPKNLKCLVCRTIFEELDKVMLSIDKWKKVDVGNFRMDAAGNTLQDKVPAHRSSVYISEVVDSICKKMDDYVRVVYKSTGKLTIMKLTTDDGKMNPEFGKTTFITDDDLNKSLEYYCERMFEENEDEILELYKNRAHDDVMPESEKEICFAHTNYCEDWMIPNETDNTWTREMEEEYVKINGPDPYGFGNFGGGAPPEPVMDDFDFEDAPEDMAKDEL